MKNSLIFVFALIGLLFVSCSDDDDTTSDQQTIVDIAVSDSQFSTLVEALQRTNLVSTLEGSGPFTVFAPTNDAFAQLGVDLATISDAELTNILLYHVLGANIRSTDLSEGQTYASTASTGGPNNQQLSILVERAGSAVTVNGSSSVTSADIASSNGVIHVFS